MADQTNDPAVPLAEEAVKNTVDLDELSLEQALMDVDVANARVIDLTKRLTAMNRELRQTTTSLQKAQLNNRTLRAELRAIRESRAFRSASAAQRVVSAARTRLTR